MVITRSDGTTVKLIIRAGQVGGISGYVCLSADGGYFAGVLAPGTVGYVDAPSGTLPATSTLPDADTTGAVALLLIGLVSLAAVGVVTRRARRARPVA